MKTAMQELIEWIDKDILLNTYYGYSPRLKEGAQMVRVKASELVEKEKEQIEKSYDKGTIHSSSLGKYMDGEDYYSKTYTKPLNNDQ